MVKGIGDFLKNLPEPDKKKSDKPQVDDHSKVEEKSAKPTHFLIKTLPKEPPKPEIRKIESPKKPESIEKINEPEKTKTVKAEEKRETKKAPDLKEALKTTSKEALRPVAKKIEPKPDKLKAALKRTSKKALKPEVRRRLKKADLLKKALLQAKPKPRIRKISKDEQALEILEKALPHEKPEPTVEKIEKVKTENSKIVEFLEESLPKSEVDPEILEVGEVAYIGDGICKIVGLSNARIDDVLRIKTQSHDVLVLVLGISNDLVESVVLGEYTAVKKGDLVFSTQMTLKVPSGKGALGRVMSPIGKPVDGKGEIPSEKDMDVERPAPAVYMRAPIVDQIRTGFLVVDSIIPVGKGQRELVTGDRKTGKTRLMADIICNLKGKNIICVYATIGAQKAKVKAFAQYLEKRGALDYTAIVMGSSDDPPSLNYLAPYAGSAIAEYFSDKGGDVLVIYDDLSKHAKAYRQMSLLLKRSPGRDAYPGDIFYLHSRLLERSAKCNEKYGGGTITALPMSETQNGDISEYITTNLMSITDGHIYLDAQMMHDGVLPAVNSGASVSRIGGSIQPPTLRNLAAIAGSQLARYNEVKSYETMNTEITEETEREINRGKRILEFFTQPSGVCYNATEETILLYIVTGGLTDYIPLDLVAKMKVEVIDYYRQNPNDFKDLTASADTRDKELSKKCEGFLSSFIESYSTKMASDSAKALKEAIEKKKAKDAAAKAGQSTENTTEKK